MTLALLIIPSFPLTIRRLELESEKIHALGQHDDAISSVCYSNEASCVYLISLPFQSSLTFLSPFFLQIPSSLVPGIVRSVSGTHALRPRSSPLTLSPNASTSWTLSATALSSPLRVACSTFSTFARWTRPSRRARAPSNSSPGPSPACPTAKVGPSACRLYSLDKLWLPQGTRLPPSRVASP